MGFSLLISFVDYSGLGRLDCQSNFCVPPQLRKCIIIAKPNMHPPSKLPRDSMKGAEKRKKEDCTHTESNNHSGTVILREKFA